VNASPDLSQQIQGFNEIQPRPQKLRNSPIRGVLLTNADLDHLLGLFSLREGGPLDVYATKAVRATAQESLGLEDVLNAFCTLRWHEPNFDKFEPLEPNSPVSCRAIELPGRPPPFADRTGLARTGIHSVAYEFLDTRSSRRLIVAPDVAAINQRLLAALNESEAVIFDGTFWSADELAAVRPGAKQAADMGHITIHNGSLELLTGLSASTKVYLHINNTNPILAVDSPERSAVELAGVIVGHDGMEFEL
jgi:pyrroloquinoline quinone biosynthesis protein B